VPLVHIIQLMYLCVLHLQSDTAVESSPVNSLRQTALVLPGHIMYLEETEEMR